MNNLIEEDCLNIIQNYKEISFKHKRVLITGATGQIGTYFIVFFYLLKKINKDLMIDAYFHTSIPPHLSKYESDINFIKFDLGENVYNKSHQLYDFIIYGAGYGQPMKFSQNKEATFMINSAGLMNQISLLNKKGKFLYLSTTEVYANNKIDRETEIDNIILKQDNMRNSYIISKLMGEEIVKTFQTESANLKVARVCLAYGPGTKINDSRVLNELINQAINQKSIALLDSGTATRTYCYILDSLKMLLDILFFGRETIYNVGNPENISIIQLAKIIGQICNVTKIVIPDMESNFKFDVRTHSPSRVAVNIDKYVKEFGLPNFRKIEDGVSRTIAWQKENLFKGVLN